MTQINEGDMADEPFSDELLKEAEAALKRQAEDKRTPEEWAKDLADDLSKFTD